MSLDRLTVALGERAYDIHIDAGLIDRAGPLIAAVTRGRRTFVVSDDVVAPLYLGRLQASLDAAGLSHGLCVLPAGEGTKDFVHLATLMDSLLAARAERSTMVVALGGGVIGDLAGFAAAICLRGLDFVQIPTTLLAQVDSSVGGKTGINTSHGKNLVGSFHQPRLVLADIAALGTLERRHLLAGYAEIVKYGVIGDEGFFTWLEANGALVIGGDQPAQRHAIATSCRAKAEIVAGDERESGRRALLNLGHTFGHALEAECGFGDEMLHGEAVAIGMAMALRLSVALGLAPESDALRLERHLAAIGLPVGLPGNRRWESDRLLHHMAGDKKVADGKVTFVLAKSIGEGILARDIPAEAVRGVLDHFVAGIIR